MAKDAFTAKSLDPALSKTLTDQAKSCAEAISEFERNENALGVRSIPFDRAPKFGPLLIDGVELSVRPDLLTEATGRNSIKRFGCSFIKVQKAPDPSKVKTPSRKLARAEMRREIARYMLSMLIMMLQEHGQDLGQLDRELCAVIDVRLGERIPVPSDHVSRARDITNACREIRVQWTSIEPAKSQLDP